MFSFSAIVALFGVYLIYKTFSSLPEGAPTDTMTGADWAMVITGVLLIFQYLIKMTLMQDKSERDTLKRDKEETFPGHLTRESTGPVTMYLERAKVHIKQGNGDLALDDLKTFIQMANNMPSLEEQINEANAIVEKLEKEA